MSDKYPIYEYDSNGNVIYYKDSDGYEEWWEYCSNKLIHYKSSNGCEWWRGYGSNGRVTYSKYSNGSEEWYDEKGKRTEDPVKILMLSQKLYSEASR